jgi:hypothetical protein
MNPDICKRDLSTIQKDKKWHTTNLNYTGLINIISKCVNANFITKFLIFTQWKTEEADEMLNSKRAISTANERALSMTSFSTCQ